MVERNIEALEAEIARLRALCEEYDIDPDWPVSQAPSYSGPPDVLTTETLRSRGVQLAESVMQNNPLLRYLSKRHG